MIVHIFTAERYHLTPNISKGFITTYKNDAQHRFILWGSKNTNTKLYKELYDMYGFQDYCFCSSKCQMAKAIWKNRHKSILFHAGSYWQFLLTILLGCKNVNWICWGGGASIRKNKRFYFSAQLKRWVYRHFRTIVTLMDDDRASIIRDFKVSEERIFTIPYASGGDTSPKDNLCLQLLKQNNDAKIDKPLVLLGNNPSNMTYYLQLMERLRAFKGKIRVQCMMNYSVERNERYEAFIRRGKELFGDDFRSNEEFYEGTESYVNYMNTCDIYMCGNPNQSGLGAVNTTLALGKKIYLTGKNYNWAKEHFHAIVYDIISIKDYETLVTPLTSQEKMHNYYSVVSHRSGNANLWHTYLQQQEKKLKEQ